MWKKEDELNTPSTGPASADTGSRQDKPRRSAYPNDEQATIGRSITIRGDVTGDEDLFIQGRIEGTVDLQQHNVTVGSEGRVKANISARTVTVEGEVNGDVRGQEQVSLRASSKVNGDIVSPRVVLEDGATFLGSIDMSNKMKGAGSSHSTITPAAGNAPKTASSKPMAVETSTAKN